MPRINAQKAQVGMKVIRDVTDAEGMLLIPADCVLGEKHVDMLLSWGISEIEVEADATEDASANQPWENLTPEELEQLQAQVLARFYAYDDQSPVMQEAFRLALQRQAGRNKQEAAP